MERIVQGLILGFVIVLPGMSGGTVFLIFGFYEQMVKDFAKLNIKPYMSLIAAMVVGIFVGGMAFALFFESYRDATATFLLGCLLASIRSVLKGSSRMHQKEFIALAIGLVVGFYVGAEPIGVSGTMEEVSWAILLLGGALSSAAMIIPGVPGSSVLIMLGIYDSMLFYIKELDMINLLIFATGALMGLFLLINILEKLYERYRNQVSYFFAGLIVASSRALLPSSLSIGIVLLFLTGFGIVWYWSSKN
ncbi:protein of unknown function DUF368 [Alkaliphilus metalliredigens QYMF]|uniref:DUF368 domain-containing protein n=1 Tax=Alkaliphilus metalliredigens (strain QYMF) TaxID=293826 RepID=A6TL58_ALKMQ|nr:DUF368 domain-containing protein [Alkaliphilus metalliredigens]ABR46926.1 protein of unknown function DUF368 [Alkaliphilus metalliredigens QYMF]